MRPCPNEGSHETSQRQITTDVEKVEEPKNNLRRDLTKMQFAWAFVLHDF
jgi:hypothetical protein